MSPWNQYKVINEIFHFFFFHTESSKFGMHFTLIFSTSQFERTTFQGLTPLAAVIGEETVSENVRSLWSRSQSRD